MPFNKSERTLVLEQTTTNKSNALLKTVVFTNFPNKKDLIGYNVQFKMDTIT